MGISWGFQESSTHTLKKTLKIVEVWKKKKRSLTIVKNTTFDNNKSWVIKNFTSVDVSSYKW